MKKISTFVLGTLLIVSCKNLDKYNRHLDKKLTIKQMIRDVDYVEKNLFRLHPDVDWYISQQQLHAQFDSLRTTITEPLTPNEFFLKISPIISQVRQGHMSMYPLLYTHSHDTKKKYRGSTHPLTGFEYIYKEGRLYISTNNRKDKRDKDIQIGTEIISINGIKPEEVFKKYRNTFTSDGFNETFIEPYFARRVNTYYNAELKFVDSVRMELKCADSVYYHTSYRIFKEKKSKKDKQKKSTQDSLSAIKKDSLSPISKVKDSLKKPELSTKELKKERRRQREKKLIEDRLRRWKGYDTKTKTFAKELLYPVANDSTIALLKLRTFSEGNPKIYDTIFKEIAHHKVENLIIDLRGNTGGHLSDIYKLSAYLNENAYYFVEPATVTKKTFAFHMFKGKSLLFKSLLFPFWGPVATVRTLKTKKEDGVWKNYSKYSKIAHPKQPVYTNKLYVLTDGLTFSAGAILASHLDGLEQATFVGEETGGTYNGTVAGQMPQLKLPHSKLRWRMGLMSIKPAHQTEKEGYGVLPNVPINLTIDDILEKNDPALDYILQEIENEKQ